MREISEYLKRFVVAVETIAVNMEPITITTGPNEPVKVSQRDEEPAEKQKESGQEKTEYPDIAHDVFMPAEPPKTGDNVAERKNGLTYRNAIIKQVQKIDPEYAPPNGTRAVTLLKILQEKADEAGITLPVGDLEYEVPEPKGSLENFSTPGDEELADDHRDNKETEETITRKVLVDLTTSCVKVHGAEKTQKVVVGEFAKRISDIPEDQWGKYVDRMTEFLKKGE